MKSSPAARELIKRHETFRPRAEQAPDGRWVVGFGHRAAARAGVEVSRDEAELLLIYDVMQAEEALDDICREPLARGQRDALISYVHDIGPKAFRETDVARYLYEGRVAAAGEALAADGDVANPRREAESAHFFSASAPRRLDKASQPVELVIKVEHPAEERQLESAAAGGTARPAPPPPPPSARHLASRREAEAEIARILAAVEAMPPEAKAELVADDDEAVPAVQANVVDQVTARMDTEIADAEPMAEAGPLVEAGDTETVGAGDPEIPPFETPEVEPQPIPEIDPDPAPGPEIDPNREPLPDTDPIPEIEPDPTPDIEPGPGTPTDVAPVAELPAGLRLGHALTHIDLPQVDPIPADIAVEDQAHIPGRAAEPRPAEAAVTEIVEQAMAEAGQAELPHPAELPAASSGAVGEVAGEPGQRKGSAGLASHHDPLVAGDDPLIESDDFTPRDLAADVHEHMEKPLPRHDEEVWPFAVALVSGVVVSAIGAMGVWGDLTRIWAERDLTREAIFLLGGGFLSIAAAWQLVAIWLGRSAKMGKSGA
ncbi:lysozyme [Maricaulis sp. CAU 1757]